MAIALLLDAEAQLGDILTVSIEYVWYIDKGYSLIKSSLIHVSTTVV